MEWHSIHDIIAHVHPKAKAAGISYNEMFQLTPAEIFIIIQEHEERRQEEIELQSYAIKTAILACFTGEDIRVFGANEALERKANGGITKTTREEIEQQKDYLKETFNF